jgi:hypothetical protein
MWQMILADLTAMFIWELGKVVIEVYKEVKEEKTDLQISKI